MERGGVWGRLSVRVAGTPSGPPETRSSTHARLSAGLGDWVGGTAWMRGLRGVLRGAGGHPPPMCTPRQWPDSARSGRGAPHFGGARLACIGVLSMGSGSQFGIPRNPAGHWGLPASPSGSGGVASGLWEGRSLPTRPERNPSVAVTRFSGDCQPWASESSLAAPRSPHRPRDGLRVSWAGGRRCWGAGSGQPGHRSAAPESLLYYRLFEGWPLSARGARRAAGGAVPWSRSQASQWREGHRARGQQSRTSGCQGPSAARGAGQAGVGSREGRGFAAAARALAVLTRPRLGVPLRVSPKERLSQGDKDHVPAQGRQHRAPPGRVHR